MLRMLGKKVQQTTVRFFFSLIFPRKQILTFLMSKSIFWGKKERKIFQNDVCWNHYPHYEKHAYSNILKISPPKNEKFQIKNSDIFFIFLLKNIDCGCSLELPQWGSSNEYQQSMFLSRIKKNNIYPCKPQFYYITRGPRATVRSPEWQSHCRHADVPNNICKDSAIRHPRFWRIRFLNVFPLQMHREANLYDHDFINFGRPPVPDDLSKDSAPRRPRFWRRRFLMVFTIYGHGGHLGQWTATILAIFYSSNLRRHHMEISAKLAQRLQRRSCLKFWIFFPYKCIRKQDWPHGKRANVNVRPLF